MRFMCDKKGNIVRLKDDAGNVVGSGVLYYEKNLGDSIYILTAAHCLHKDCDKFTDLLTVITHQNVSRILGMPFYIQI